MTEIAVRLAKWAGWPEGVDYDNESNNPACDARLWFGDADNEDGQLLLDADIPYPLVDSLHRLIEKKGLQRAWAQRLLFPDNPQAPCFMESFDIATATPAQRSRALLKVIEL